MVSEHTLITIFPVWLLMECIWMYCIDIIIIAMCIQTLHLEIQEVRLGKKWPPDLTWFTHVQTLHLAV